MSKKAAAHPVYRESFEAIVKAGFDLTALDIKESRALFDLDLKDYPFPETIVEKMAIPVGPDKQSVNLTIVRPVGTENKVLPGLVFLHGGGWVLGSGFKSSEKIVKELVVNAHIAVIYVDYSLSPEVRFPVAVEECYSSILWLHENASTINIDSSKLAVGGDSAGGTLSAAVTIMLSQRGYKDLIKGQVLIFPALAHPDERKKFDSYTVYGDGDYLLSRKDMAFFSENYFGTEDWPLDVRIAPLLATLDELKNVPRALVLTAECDILRDEGEAYARKLTEAGVDTCCVRTIGATHGYATARYNTPQYRRTINMISDFLKTDVFGN